MNSSLLAIMEVAFPLYSFLQYLNIRRFPSAFSTRYIRTKSSKPISKKRQLIAQFSTAIISSSIIYDIAEQMQRLSPVGLYISK